MRSSIVIALFALTACEEDPPPASDVEACTLLEMGPYMALTAVTSRDISTPAVADNGNAFTVTLTASGFGYVKFDATAGKHVLYLDRNIGMNVLEGAGTPATLSSATSSDACPTIMGRHAVTLMAGTAYFGFNSDAGAPVNFVVAAP